MVEILFGGLGWRRRKTVELEAETPKRPTLVVVADSSNVRVRPGRGDKIVVRGVASSRGTARIVVYQSEGGEVEGRVELYSADVVVEAPAKAVGVVCDSSSISINFEEESVEFVSVKSDSCGINVRALLEEGGGHYAWLDSSGLNSYLKPSGEGGYWVEVEADSSGAKIEFEGKKRYIIEEEKLVYSRLSISDPDVEASVEVRAKVIADSSSIRLL